MKEDYITYKKITHKKMTEKETFDNIKQLHKQNPEMFMSPTEWQKRRKEILKEG